MTLSAADRETLDLRSTLSDRENNILSLTLHDLDWRATNAHIPLAKDDRLTALEAALIRYILASRTNGAKLVKGYRSTRLSDVHQVVLETLYIVREDGTVASSQEHAFSTNFTGDWQWTERPEMSVASLAHAEFIGNYPDPLK